MSADVRAAKQRSLVMVGVGVLALVASAVWLVVAAEPFPMWLIIAGGGLLFIGAGSALRRRDG